MTVRTATNAMKTAQLRGNEQFTKTPVDQEHYKCTELHSVGLLYLSQSCPIFIIHYRYAIDYCIMASLKGSS